MALFKSHKVYSTTTTYKLEINNITRKCPIIWKLNNITHGPQKKLQGKSENILNNENKTYQTLWFATKDSS